MDGPRDCDSVGEWQLWCPREVGTQFAVYEDGVRTQRNSFQKYYVQNEFRSYVEKTLGANAIPIAAGICLVFRDAMEEQLFLLARQQVRRGWRLLRREPNSEAVASLIEEHREQIDTYWLRALELGRPAAPERNVRRRNR